MCKKRIGVLFGGRSEEHEVSLISASSVIRALDSEKFVPIYIGITRNGKWKKYDGPAEKIQDGSWEETATDLEPGQLSEIVDFALPILHGPYGEDGCIQGFLETLGIPYGGCGVLASAVSMDKQLFKQLMKENRLPVCGYISFTRKEALKDLQKAALKVMEAVGLPCFVKPANMGSSVGINKAGTEEELIKALKNACLYDDKIVAEEYIDGRELEIAAIGGEEPELTDIGEIIPSTEFYDYAAKYGGERHDIGIGNRERQDAKSSQLIIPADIGEEIKMQIKSMAEKAYKAVGGYGFCRIDFFLKEQTKDIYINEINTIPGFTGGSMFPLLWEHQGLNLRQIIERIVDLGYERDYIRNNRKTTI